jgi:release factor glutamine methyltransferase
VRIDLWIESASARLAEAGHAAARLEAELLAAHAAGKDRVWIKIHPEAPIDEQAEAFLTRRLNWEPLAYILGHREFCGLDLLVDESVLVPRFETESLVEEALKLAEPASRILDLGTGSGCIALAMKAALPSADVVGADISPAALKVARENGRRTDLDVEWLESDLFDSVAGEFDLIITNPPYVASNADLPRDVAEWEPAKALFSSDQGTSHFKRIAEQASARLKPRGVLVAECGVHEPEVFWTIFEERGWTLIRWIGDDVGKWGFSCRFGLRLP